MFFWWQFPLLIVLLALLVWVLIRAIARTASRAIRQDVAQSKAQVTLPARATKRCPFCAEDIMVEARLCRFCGHDLVNPPGPGSPGSPGPSGSLAPPAAPDSPRRWRLMLKDPAGQSQTATVMSPTAKDARQLAESRGFSVDYVEPV